MRDDGTELVKTERKLWCESQQFTLKIAVLDHFENDQQ